MERRVKIKNRGRQQQLVLEMGACEVRDSDIPAVCTAVEQVFDKKVAELGMDTAKRVDWSLFLLLEENHITAAGLTRLVDWILAFQHTHATCVSVYGLRLHMNDLDDEAALVLADLVSQLPEPLRELHLSHNRISETGAVALLLAIANKEESPYPSIISTRTSADKQRSTCKVKPLWLRLEQNRIDVDAVKAELQLYDVLYTSSMKHREMVVTVKAGHRKGRGHDASDNEIAELSMKLPKFNIPFFGRLSQQLKVSTLFSQAPALQLCEKNQAQTQQTEQYQQSSNDPAGSIDDPFSLDVSVQLEKLIFVLDTNAVVDMCSEYNQALSFDAMLKELNQKRRADNSFSDPFSTPLRVLFVLLDTVRKELVGIKSASNHKIRRAVNHFFGHVLEDAVEAGLLVIADPVELEDVVQRRGGHAWRPSEPDSGSPTRTPRWAAHKLSDIARSIASGQRDNDGMILDCTNILASLSLAQRQVVLLSSDIELTVRAHQFGVSVIAPRAMTSDLLFNLQCWSEVLRHSRTPRRQTPEGVDSPEQTRAPPSNFSSSPVHTHSSVYTAMEDAVKLTEESCSIIHNFLAVISQHQTVNAVGGSNILEQTDTVRIEEHLVQLQEALPTWAQYLSKRERLHRTLFESPGTYKEYTGETDASETS